jgi:hypothetical protein
VAFDARQSDTIQYGDKTGPLDTDGHTMGLNIGATVRRLTPRECERLQGFPEQKNVAILLVCSSDRLKNSALAEIQNPKSPSYASLADASALMRSVENAALPSSINLLCRERPVALHVQIDLEREAVLLRRAGKLLWSADSAAQAKRSPLRGSVAAIVRASVLLSRALGPGIIHGRAALHQSNAFSLRAEIGSVFAPVSGLESAALVRNADAFTKAENRFTKFITSEATPNSQHYAENLAISPSYVTAAISGFIPAEIRNADLFAIPIEVVCGHTFIPYRGKPAADGPRYKALGNSMAVPVLSWIGRRIAAVDGK